MIFDKCILCFKPLTESDPPEHVIPDSLGGRLKEVVICKKCNHGISAKLYSQLKFDAHVRRASLLLRNDLPKIFEAVENQQQYTTISPLGSKLNAKRSNSGIQVTAKVYKDIAVLPTKNAVRYFESKLVKDHGNDAHNLASSILDHPNNKLGNIPGYSFVRWNPKEFKPDFTLNGIVEGRSMILMAYEYLSMLLGKSIFYPVFDNVRAVIIGGGNNKYIPVSYFTSPKPQPFHLIYPEFEDDRTRININLFEYAIAKVEFINIHISKSPDFCYLEDLINRRSFGAPTVGEGKVNQWSEFDF